MPFELHQGGEVFKLDQFYRKEMSEEVTYFNIHLFAELLVVVHIDRVACTSPWRLKCGLII